MGLSEFSGQIGVSKNKFVLLDCEDEVDPHELLKQQEVLREAKKRAKNAEKAVGAKVPQNPERKQIGKKQQSKPAPETVVNNIQAQKPQTQAQAKPARETDNRPVVKQGGYDNRPVGKQGGYDNRPVGKQGGYVRPSYHEGKENITREEGSNEPRGDRRGGFSRVFIRGGTGRGRGSGHGYDDRRGKREYERHSGSDKTGVKPVDKRRGEGPFNSGSVLPKVLSLNEVKEIEGEVWNDEKSAGDSPKIDDPKPPSPVPPKDEELTLEEYKKLKSSRPKPEYNIRKPGEGEDLSQWTNMVALGKKGEEPEGEDLDYGEFPQRVGRLKRLHVNFNFSDRDRRGGGRGGRGGGSYRGSHQTQVSEVASPPPAPCMLDEKDFPSLT